MGLYLYGMILLPLPLEKYHHSNTPHFDLPEPFHHYGTAVLPAEIRHWTPEQAEKKQE